PDGGWLHCQQPQRRLDLWLRPQLQDRQRQRRRSLLWLRPLGLRLPAGTTAFRGELEAAMTDGDFSWPADDAAPAERGAAAYRDGYQRAMRELAWARTHGFVPTERQIVRALAQALKVYQVVHGGKSIAGRRPEWLRGRADALRTLLREGAITLPAPDSETG